MQFDCVCFVFFGQACFVVLVQALRCLFATPLSLGRLRNGMFYVKLSQAQRPFIRFYLFFRWIVHVLFFCVQVGRRPCWSRLCVVFRNTIAVWAGGATACFRQKFAGTAWFSLFAVFSVEKCVAIGFC